MDAIIGFLNNPAVLTIGGILWGFVIKYHPSWKAVPNHLIPWLTAIVTFIVKVCGPVEAQAAPGFVVAAGGLLGAALSAGWQAVVNSLIYETFLKTPAGTILKKP